MSEDEPIRCRACGMVNPPAAIFCSNCNRPLSEAPAATEPQTTEERIETHLASIRTMMAFFVVLALATVTTGFLIFVTNNS